VRSQQETRNVYLVGLMGAGKTTVGKALAKRLGYRFVDSDHEVEVRTGVSLATIFEIEGEDGFRKREAQLIAELAELRQHVVATGGGSVLRPENRLALRSARSTNGRDMTASGHCCRSAIRARSCANCWRSATRSTARWRM